MQNTARNEALASDLRKKAERLRNEIRRHDFLYYTLDRPEISDAAYDRLLAQLVQLETAHPELVTADSPTQRVTGAPSPPFGQVRHVSPMLSLEATREEAAVRRFDARLRAALREARGSLVYVVEPKFDGLSLEVVWQDGVLVRAATRGDGSQGEDVTENVRTIRSVPLRLREQGGAAPRLLAARGEVLMPRAAFRALNQALAREGRPPFANPRNAAAGSVRQLDPRITASRQLEVTFYDVLAVEGITRWRTASQATEALRAWGLPTSKLRRRLASPDEICAYYQRLLAQRDALEIEIDGVVIKADELSARERLGATGHHPRWALAWKFPPRGARTRIREIVVQVGRTGVLTPVAVVEPVRVGGVTVTRATLHNREELSRKDLRVGDAVSLVRAGDVIPEIVERIPEPARRRAAPFQMPRACPACGTTVERAGPFDVCPNGACPAQLARALQHFASRRAMDIAGIGVRTAEALVAKRLVGSVADLFALTRAELATLEGFGDLAAAKLERSIRAARRRDLARFLFALGIPGVGPRTAERLARSLRSLRALRTASETRLSAVPGVGPELARAIHAFLRVPSHRRMIDACIARGVQIVDASGPQARALAGKTFVFTGTLPSMTRESARALVAERGGQTASEVSTRTAFVVVGNAPGAKLARARRLGIRVISEREFLSLLEAPGRAPRRGHR